MGVDACLVVTSPVTLTVAQVARLSGELCARLGHESFWIDKKEGRHALSIRKDFDCSDDQAIEVNWMTCYYGVGYERGNWPLINATIEFLVSNVPNTTVYYYGDCSDPVIFTDYDRIKMNKHFYHVGHEPYRGYSLNKQTPPICNFCGGKPFHDVGGGGGKTFWSCDGCGQRMIDDKEIEGDFFRGGV